ncbi:DUF1883 domain-containing protein [Amycolatopsis solani]|uniref:DUF1883 domain-containing protein n=1 Tax=Amycolatopsis solani TaxID=3028615 RepID=UPI0025AF3B2F|nr:DUF1883 domain-containing protein [Amycolatopsis sp. MEP2-6]
MEANVFDLGKVRRDAVVTVRLDAMANVRLLTEVNFQAYRRRQYYRMHGGVATAPMFKIHIPANAHWFLVLDVEGLENLPLRPRVSVEPEPAATARGRTGRR